MHGLGFALLLALYFLPTLIGHNKANVGAIFVLNLFLGWTVIGWIVALVWACTVDRRPEPAPVVVTHVAQAPPRTYCTTCGQALDGGGRFCSRCGSRIPD